jgi:hypothetical protein
MKKLLSIWTISGLYLDFGLVHMKSWQRLTSSQHFLQAMPHKTDIDCLLT